MSPHQVVLLLTLLLGMQPLTTDLYLPALPALTADFGGSMGQAQLTLSALVLAFGISQLFWGPLSDRFGRRPVLLIGMAAGVLAGFGCSWASSMESLILWRVVQGVAMGAGVVCARAIVRDLYEPAEGVRVMSRGLSGLAVIACLSAPVGGALAQHLGWRTALQVLPLFSLLCLVVVALRYIETAPPPAARQPLAAVQLMATWRSILGNRTFLAFSVLSGTSYAGLFTILAASSFVYIQALGLSKTGYGLVMLVNSITYLGSTFLCRRLLARWGLRRTVAVAGVLSLGAGTLMATLALTGVRGVWAMLLPQCIFMVGHGIHQPCGQSGAVGPFPQAAGAASALNGFIMMALAFGVGSWLGAHMDGTVLPMALGVWFWSALIALCAWTLVQKHGQP